MSTNRHVFVKEVVGDDTLLIIITRGAEKGVEVHNLELMLSAKLPFLLESSLLERSIYSYFSRKTYYGR